MINSFKNPAIMRILRTTERYEAGWREQNFIPEKAACFCANVQKIETGCVKRMFHFDILYFFDKRSTLIPKQRRLPVNVTGERLFALQQQNARDRKFSKIKVVFIL